MTDQETTAATGFEARHWDDRFDALEGAIAAREIPQESWKVITDILQSTRVVASYVHGADDTFAALTECTQRARTSLRVTRLAPRSIVGSNVSYMNAVYRSVKDPENDNRPHVRDYTRLVGVNNPTKEKDVIDTIMHCYGAPMDIYLTTAEYGFELLLADSHQAFIMFADEHDAITSALYLRGGDLSRELEKVFDSMLKRGIVDVINCADITESNIAESLQRVHAAWASCLMI